MMILMITDSFPPAEGGARLYYYNIYKNFPNEEVIILTKKVKGWESFDEQVDFKIIRKSYPLPNWKYKNIFRTIPYFIYALWIIKKYRVSMVHCGDLFPAGIIGLTARYFWGAKYLIYCHGEDLTLPQKYRFQPKLYKLIYKKASVIIAACEYAEIGLKKMGISEKKIKKVNPGVDCEQFRPMKVENDIIKKYDIKDRKVILTICRLVERKGIDLVIKSLPEVLRKIPNTIYLIGGRGPYKEVLENLVNSLNLQKYVKFLGFVPQDEISILYNVCNVFVMCNKKLEQSKDIEGFGMVFLEANATGKPVIGGNTGGTNDSIIDGVTGYRVDSNSLEEVTDRLIKILSNEKLAIQMGDVGRKRAKELFNWEDRADNIKRISSELIIAN